MTREEDKSAQQEEIEQLKAKVAELTKWSAVMFGAPGEEIRHAQQVEALEAEIARLKTELNTRRNHVV